MGDGAAKKNQPQLDQHGQPLEKGQQPGSDGAASQMSNQATAPGDASALAAVRGQGGSTPGSFGQVSLTDGQGNAAPAKATLDQQAVEKKIQEIHDALYHRALWGIGWSSPDADKIFRELDSLNQADRQAIEKAYAQKYGGSGKDFHGDELRRELKDKLSSDDDARAVAMLNRQDGHTNDAGQVKTLLTQLDSAAGKQHHNDSWNPLHVLSDVVVPAKFLYERYQNHELSGDRANDEKQLRETIAGLNSQQLAQLDTDYRAEYGKSFRDSILHDKNLSPETRAALEIYLKNPDPSKDGIDQRSAQDQLDLANLGLKYHNVDMIGEALRGDTPAAQQARARFRSAQGDDKLKSAFSGDDLQKARDFMNDGRIDLATIAHDDTEHWYHTNRSDLEQQLTNATQDERQEYTQGRQLALAHQNPTTDAQRQALDFYNRTHKALKDAASNDRELAVFEDKLMYGGSLITQLCDTHSDGWWFTGIGSGHDTGDLLSKIENMSQQDWQRLKTDPGYRAQIDAALHTFAGSDEIKRADDLLDRKAKADTYDQSKTIERSLTSIIGDDTHHGWFGSTSHDGVKIIDAIANLPPQQQKQYRDDPNFRDQVNKDIDKTLDDGPQRTLAHRLLGQIAAGRQPKLDPVDQVLMDSVKGADASQTERDIEAAFRQDPTLLDRIKNPKNQQDKDIKQYFEGAFTQAMFKDGMPPEGAGYEYDRYAQVLFDKGSLPLDMKLELSSDKKLDIQDIINASDADKQRLLDPKTKDDQEFRDRVLGGLSDDEKKVVMNGLKQGKLDLADQIRQYVLGDGGSSDDLRAALQQMRNQPAAIEALKNEYVQKYGGDLDNDLISRIDDKDKITFRDLLTPAKLDGRQDFYDLMAQQMNSRSGLADSIMAAGMWDGTRDSLDRALNENAAIRGEYALKFEDLPQDEQQRLIDMYAQALQSYKDSKGQMTEQLVDAALVVGSLAAAPFSGGASLTVIAAMAAAGATFKVAATKVLEGNDFNNDPKAVAKLALEGAFTTGMMVGPAHILGVMGIGDAAAAEAVAGITARLGTTAVEEGGTAVLREGCEEAAQKALATASREAIAAGKDMTTAQLQHVAEQMVRSDLPAAVRKQAIDDITNQLARQYNVSLEQQSRTLLQKALQGGRSFVTEAAGNAAIGGGASAMSQVATFPLDYDSKLSLSQNLSALAYRMKLAGISGAAGGVAFTGVFHIVKPLGGAALSGYRGLSASGEGGDPAAVTFAFKGGDQVIAADPRNPDVQITRANGRTLTVKGGTEYKIQPGDQLTGVKPADSQLVAAQVGADALQPPGAMDSIGIGTGGGGDVRVEAGHYQVKVGSGTIELPGRKITIDGREYIVHKRPWTGQHWMYGKAPSGEALKGSVKVHVSVAPDANLADLGRLQEVLIPALNDDKELAALASDWKTMDPQIGHAGVDPGHLVASEGQGAKAFTIYARNAEDALRIQQKVDQILARHPELKLDKPFAGGNVDRVAGASNRVGITRDVFERSVDSRPHDVLAKVDNALSARILNDPSLQAYRFEVNGQPRITQQGLRKLEQQLGLHDSILQYDSQGNLVMQVNGTDRYGGAGRVYVSEEHAINTPRGTRTGTTADGRPQLSQGYTDRPALYQLSRHYGIDPVDVLAGRVDPAAVRDSRGQVLQTVDAKGNRTTFQRNADGQVTRVTYPNGQVAETSDGGTWRVMDPAHPEKGYTVHGRMEVGRDGSLTWQARGGDKITTYADGSRVQIGRISGKIDSTVSAAGVRTDYTYAPDGKLTRIARADGTVLESADGQNWTAHTRGGDVMVLRAQFQVGSDGTLWQKTPQGNFVGSHLDGSKTYRYPKDGTIQVDPRQRIYETVNAQGARTKYEYSAEGRLQKVTYANGITAQSSDGLNWRVTDPSHPDGGYSVRGAMKVESDGSLTWLPEGSDKMQVVALNGARSVRPAPPPYKVGDTVVFDGEKYVVAGFDTRSGDAILRQPGRGRNFAVISKPATTEELSKVRPVRVGSTTYYRDGQGTFYKIVDLGGGNRQLFPDYELTAVPRNQAYATDATTAQMLNRPGYAEAIGGSPQDKLLWSPERDFYKLPVEERMAIYDAIKGHLTGLAQDQPIDSFVGDALSVTSGWNKDLSLQYKQLKSLRDQWDASYAPFRDEVQPLLQGRVDMNLMTDRNAVRNTLNELVQEGQITAPEAADHLQKLDNYVQARETYSQSVSQVNQVLGERRAQLEDMINRFADSQGLPHVKIRLAEEMGSAAGTYNDGVITLRKDALLNAQDVAGLIDTAYHEFVHSEQDNGVIRMVIDQVEQQAGKPLTQLTPAESERIKTLYKGLTNHQLSDEHLQNVLAARDGRRLTPDQAARARAMAEAFKNGEPAGKVLAETGNDFRMTQKWLKAVSSTSDPNGAYKLISQLSRDPGVLSQHLFGTATPPPEVQRLINIYRAMESGAEVDWPRAQADPLLKSMLSQRLEDLNQARMESYGRYMAGVHEKEAWAVGSRAERRAVDAGASQRQNPDQVAVNKPIFFPDYAPAAAGLEALAFDVPAGDLGGGLTSLGQARLDQLQGRAAEILEYNGQVVKAQPRTGARTGDAYQLDVYRAVQSQLADLKTQGKVGPQWEVYPTAIGSGADRVGVDYLLVNTDTGDFVPLDATSNPDKRNIAELRKGGIIMYEPRLFDAIGSLRVDPEEPPDVRAAVAGFQARLASQLETLTHQPSLLNLNDTPFPDVVQGASDASTQKQIADFAGWLRTEAGTYMPGSPEARELMNYAQVLERGALAHGEAAARKVVAPKVLEANVQRAADGAMVDVAIRNVLNGGRFEPPSGAPSKAVTLRSDGKLNFNAPDGSIYVIDDPAKMLMESRSRFLDLNQLAGVIPPRRMEALRKMFPGLSDRKIVERVRDQIQISTRMIGQRTASNYRPYLDDLVARLNNRKPADLLQSPDAKPPAAEHQVVEPAPEVAAPPPVPAETITQVLGDLKYFWKDVLNGRPLNGSVEPDMVAALQMFREDESASWTPQAAAWFDELQRAYVSGDTTAITLLGNVTQ